MKTVLYNERELDKEGKLYFGRTIEANFGENGNLVIYGYDIGVPVKRFNDDSEIEYWMEISKDEVNKLSLILPVYDKDLQIGILNAIQKKFQGEGMFELIKEFLTEHKIEYKFVFWR